MLNQLQIIEVILVEAKIHRGVFIQSVDPSSMATGGGEVVSPANHLKNNNL